MNKKIIMLIIIILIILLAIFYYKPIGVNNLIQPLSSKNLPLKIETAIFFSALSDKELDVTNKESIEQIITLIESIKVRRNIITPQTYRPQFKETYRLVFNGKNSNNQYIDIFNSKYIQINHKQYEIIGTTNLSKLYDIIILDQAKGTLDEFYYNLIDNK
jgi:hypothetical protein